VDYSVAGIHHPVIGQAELGRIGGKGVNLFLGDRFLDGTVLVTGRGVVVRHAEYLLRPETLYPTLAESLECLRTGHLMAVEAVYVKQLGTVFNVVDYVRVPDFVK
jgi:hypothetical protein